MKHETRKGGATKGFCFGVMLCSLVLNFWLMTGKVVSVKQTASNEEDFVTSLVELTRGNHAN